jgi:dTDP-4-dehydrorhamnose 3,5-epimerase
MDTLMIAEPTFLDDVVLIKPKVIEDERGYFCESFKDTWFRENVCNIGFVQDNQSLSRAKGTVRGLHYQQAPAGQGKLVRVLKGAIFDVAWPDRFNFHTLSPKDQIQFTLRSIA